MSDIGYDMSDHESKGIDSLPQEGVTAMISMAVEMHALRYLH